MNTTASNDVEKSMTDIYTGLQGLFESAVPDLRKDDPRKFEQILSLVSSGLASFGARISTAPGMVTLTLIHQGGEQDLVSFIYNQGKVLN